MRAMNFAERFFALAAERSSLCVGIDPSRELLRAWSLSEDAEGLRRFDERVLEAAGDLAAVFKPQSAFYEAFGAAGMAELSRLISAIRERGALSLLDAKRGDFTSTMEGYAEGMIGEGSGFGADAATASPWLGLGALAPLLEKARRCGGAVFVVVRSSNPEGVAMQTARLADGRTTAETLADEITAFNGEKAIGPVGAVVGATLPAEEARALAARLPRSLLLAPGVGAQGAALSDLREGFGAAARRLIPSISRGILRLGPDPARLRNAVLSAQETLFSFSEEGWNRREKTLDNTYSS
ncbi:MAG: orotidine-5'-phosphate decarboxylase [Caulobacteraceae bacterium]